MSGKNERGAGRKPLSYKMVNMRIPEDLIPTVARLVSDYKINIQIGELNAKHNAEKTSK